MPEIDTLLADFIRRRLAGEDPDPWEAIDQLEGPEREQLVELIDAFLIDAPPRPWDPAAFRGSAAERLTDALDRSFRGEAGMWPALLPRLRNRARLKRELVVKRLAESLGVSDREPRVASYYHQMEQGTLRSGGVSPRVLDALANIFGTSAAALRSAGEPLGRTITAESDDAAVFARTAETDQASGAAAPAAPARPQPELDAEWDEVDELFRSG